MTITHKAILSPAGNNQHIFRVDDQTGIVSILQPSGLYRYSSQGNTAPVLALATTLSAATALAGTNPTYRGDVHVPAQSESGVIREQQ
jgi:hypothetical protein